MKFGSGQSVRRLEDVRLVQGRGTYTDDIALPGMVHAVMLRSPLAHARILSIDAGEAAAQPGVLAVYTGADCDAAGLGDIPCTTSVRNADGSRVFVPARRPIATDRVRFVGDTVAMVVAETVEAARDAADLILVDYDELPAVTGTARAADPAAPVLYDAHGSNVVLDWELGDRAGTEAALERAAHVVALDLVNNRVVVASMEPRVAIGAFADGRYTLHTPSQGVHGLRDRLAGAVLKVPPETVRVLTPEVGGGFGMKSFVYPEQALVLFAAKALGRPVKWRGERADAFLTDTQGRDHVTRAELALDAEGRFLAVRVDTIANLGAYLSQFAPFIPTLAAGGMQVGVYDIPLIHQRVRGVLTNTTPIDAYRGAGRPEASYVIERLVDAAARETGIAPETLRERNFIAPDRFPYRTAYGSVMDSGEFARLLRTALARADQAGFAARQAGRAREGRLSGLGMAYYVERTAAGQEHARIRVLSDGTVRLHVGTQTNGQGHETALAQIVAERLGIDIERVQLAPGDSDALAEGNGTGGSRSLVMAGGAAGQAADAALEAGAALAARELQTERGALAYEAGVWTAPAGASIGLFDVAAIAARENPEAGGLGADAAFSAATNTFPNGAHVCEVVIDPETGVVEIARYTVVDDFGVVLNPLLVAGQVQGGVAQGLGQAMGEQAVYDPETGQLLTGSFMDYWLPRAGDLPDFDVTKQEVPCRTNPLGVKGCGEAGTVGACGAFVNAVLDALAPYGVRHVDMPVTPEKIWTLTGGRMP
ncbi:MAG: xanthine dehydrogenase family protein molybdopterin-binding subunit [Alphaproteobacteria bacterium]|nr:xanthine dehydrogenase family protein molybdopterin-binding subunit [Alphaproteobacteria bacterium]